MRDDALGVEEFDRAEAIAAWAGAHRIVEREKAWLELRKRVIARRRWAGVLGREKVLLAGIALDHDGAPIGMAQRRLERFGEPLLRLGARAQAGDDNFHPWLAGLC